MAHKMNITPSISPVFCHRPT